MSADFDQLNARRQRVCAVVKRHAVGVDTPDQVDHVLNVVRMAEQPMAHVPATGVVELLFLDVKACVGQEPDVARVVIVQVRDHHVLNVLWRVPQHSQCLNRATDKRATPLLGSVRVKTSIDQHDAILVADQPHKIIHRHVFIMRVVRDEVVVAWTLLHGCVTQREHLIVRQCHPIPCRLSFFRLFFVHFLVNLIVRSIVRLIWPRSLCLLQNADVKTMI